jgi:hypothetical protein
LLLLAYLDEFGHIGPYIGPVHRKFGQHPVFGYAGFVIPAERSRAFQASIVHHKERHFRAEIRASDGNPRLWERKGSEMFTTGSYERYPQNMGFVATLVARLRQLEGRTFFYGQVKPLGTAKETGESARARNGYALQQSIRRLAAYAHDRGEHLMIFLDQTDPKMRAAAADDMARAIYSWDEPGMRQVVQVPAELDSARYGAIQFADWIAAVVTRASHYHLVPGSEFSWAPAQLDRLCAGQTLSQATIWHREARLALGMASLKRNEPWHTWVTTRQSQESRARGTNTAIGEQHPRLLRLRNELEADRAEGLSSPSGLNS